MNILLSFPWGEYVHKALGNQIETENIEKHWKALKIIE